MKREAKMQLYSDGARGVYIPQHFAESIRRECVTGIDLADLDYLADVEKNMADDGYWDVWQDVCDHAVVTDQSDGTVYTLYQDGGLWLVEQGATYNGEGSDEPASDIDCMFYMDDEEQS